MLYLRQLRENKGVSQAEVARIIGISRQTYNNYELGKRQADYEMLLKLAEYFDTTVENIITGRSETVEINNEVPQEPSDKTEREVKLIARKTKDLPEEDREALLELLNSTVDTFLKAKGIKND